MMRVVPILLLGAGLLAAADNHAFALAAGVAYRYNDAARSATDDNGDFSWNDDYGYHLRMGSGAPSPGLIGWGSLDLDWARNSGNGNRIDTIGALYIERVPIGPLRIGVGLGSFYSDVHLGSIRDKDWSIGGTATVSVDLFGPLYIEGGYNLTSFFNGKTAGLKTDYVFVDLGIKF